MANNPSAARSMRWAALLMLVCAALDVHRGLVLFGATLSSAGVCAIASLEIGDNADQRTPRWIRLGVYAFVLVSGAILITGLTKAVLR